MIKVNHYRKNGSLWALTAWNKWSCFCART